MQIKFCGGAQTVTGSQHLLMFNGKKILLECGLFQGHRQDTYEKNQNFLYDPATLDAVVLSHAHMDHSGNIPNLIKNGYSGQIYATSATVELCQIMLRDSAHLQEKDIEWVNEIRKRRHEPPVSPLYTLAEAEAAMSHFVGIEYNKSFAIGKDLTVTFRDAGHILGSAGVTLEFKENGRDLRLGFSGDIGRQNAPLLRDPDRLRDLDVFIIESTYGNRLHGANEDVEDELAEVIREIVKSGGKIIIPAFAVGRTQAIVYILHKLYDQNRIPDLPVFVDSPLAYSATEIFRTNPDCFDRETYRIFLRENENPFGFNRLKYIQDVQDSKALNNLKYPHIIISASGMAEGGRILHHLRNNLGNPKNLVLFVGFAAANTLARRLMDGEKKVRIFGEEHTVRCKIKTMDAFSAHADRRELLDYFDTLPNDKLKHVFLVHGEADQALPLRDALRSKGYSSVQFPAPGQVFEV